MALTHPWSQGILRSAATMNGLQQEEEKTSNIANILKSSCLEGTLLPLFHYFSSTLVGGEKHQHSSINFPNYTEMKKEETIPQILRHIGEDVCQYNFSVAMPRCWLER